MLSGYNDSLSIDRIDIDGNYDPQNCRWIPLEDNISAGNADRKLKRRAGVTLSYEIASAIKRDMLACRLNDRQIARKHGLRHETIGKIRRGEQWADASPVGPVQARKRRWLSPEERCFVEQQIREGASNNEIAARIGASNGCVNSIRRIVCGTENCRKRKWKKRPKSEGSIA